MLASRKARAERLSGSGFSLIELVVVIAVLAILIAIALPNFLGVQRDARVSSVKNNLANLIKECGVRESRGNAAVMGGAATVDIAAATTQISGYEVSGFPVATASAATLLPPGANSSTFGTALTPTTPAGNTFTCYGAAMRPIAAEQANYLTYTIFYNRATGVIEQRCNGPTTAYREGCFVNANLTGGPITGGAVAGYW